jgi:hypothetical protein
MAEKTAIEQPFHVLVKNPERNSGFHSGHESEDAAIAAAKRANENAEKGGYKARYEVKAKADSPVGSDA